MTYTQLLIACGSISVLLIGWLMWKLQEEFTWMEWKAKTPEEKLADLEDEFKKLAAYRKELDDYRMPKRRKYRDNK